MPTTPTANTTLEINVLPREDGRPDGSTNHGQTDGRTDDELAVLRSTSSARVSGSPQTCSRPPLRNRFPSRQLHTMHMLPKRNTTLFVLTSWSFVRSEAPSIDSTEVIDRTRCGRSVAIEACWILPAPSRSHSYLTSLTHWFQSHLIQASDWVSVGKYQ